jgi:hypothetical protein
VGERALSFEIKPVSLKRASISDIPKSFYTGYAIEPACEVTLGDKQLVEGVDYEVSYQGNVGPGTASVTVEGIGNYRGSIVAEFRIELLGDALARRACELAYSRPAYHGGGYNGTQAYISEFAAVGFTGIYRACDRGIATVIRSAGYDYTFPKALENIVRYLGYSTRSYASGNGNATPQTSKWQQLGKYSKGDEFRGKMLPGDIVVSGGHICMYVGETIPQEVYAAELVGTSGDLGQPTSDAVWVSAHFNGSLNSAKNAALCIGNYRYALPGLAHGPGYIYRCVAPDCV